jgi:hypothetical protein
LLNPDIPSMAIFGARRRSEDAFEQARERAEQGPSVRVEPSPPSVEPSPADAEPRRVDRLSLRRLAVLIAGGLFVALGALGHDGGRRSHHAPPYSFTRPAGWSPDRNGELAARDSFENITAISNGSETILVGSFIPTTRERVIRSLILQYQLSGGALRAQRAIKVDGIEGVQLDASGGGVTRRVLDRLPLAGHRATSRDAQGLRPGRQHLPLGAESQLVGLRYRAY